MYNDVIESHTKWTRRDPVTLKILQVVTNYDSVQIASLCSYI